MKIELKEIPIKEIVKGYVNNDEEGVIGFGGLLNIRPKYQREFIYKGPQRDAVINSVRKNYPLNVMYWSKTDTGIFELLDGQQRTLSIAEYIKGEYSINAKYFHNLSSEEQQQIFDYPLMIYICEGTDPEKLAWFEVINVAGEELSPQELKNAIYSGEWVTEAKRYFSKNNCPAHQIAEKYLSGQRIRQEYLETAIKWIASIDKIGIADYMAKHQHDKNANEIWLYFKRVIDWVDVTFPKYRKVMKGIEWGSLYNKYGTLALDPGTIESEVARLLIDKDVTNQKGIYTYIFDRDERHLNIREFEDEDKIRQFETQKGVCVKCLKVFKLNEMEADHVTPWHLGGKTELSNCQMLCKDCNRRKSGK